MSDTERFLIIGAGPAGAAAARTLRDEGFGGRIQLIGAERYRPYIRPPLSKTLLAGSVDRESVFVESEAWYFEHEVELTLSTRATGLDPSAHSVTLSSGDVVSYDAVLLATGSTPRRLDIPGADLDGVRTLRTLDDSEALRAILASGGRRLVVIGSGWIGMEVAATARTLGNHVTILERESAPLVTALGADLGQVFADLHIAHGVDLRASVAIDSIEGAHGTATGVRLIDGEVIAADLVLIGIGAAPNLELAVGAHLAVDNGVLVDAAMRSSVPDVYIAGDIANAFHPLAGVRIRSEHWSNARHGARAAARSMLGQTVSYDDIPFFSTEQFDLTLEYAGFAPLTRDARLVYRGDRRAREFSAFWVADRRVVAGMSVNVADGGSMIQSVVSRGERVDLERLVDEHVPLQVDS